MLATNLYGNSPTLSTKWDVNISQKLVDALGVSAWTEGKEQTFGYRWRGQDTLTWGNLDRWIVVKWMVQRILEQDINTIAKQEVELFAVISEIRIAQLETFYQFRNSAEIRNFLTKHQELIAVLQDGHSAVEEIFGNGILIALEVVKDPEATNIEQLFGYIKVDAFSPDEAFERLNAFDEVWFIKQSDLMGGLLNFNLE